MGAGKSRHAQCDFKHPLEVVYVRISIKKPHAATANNKVTDLKVEDLLSPGSLLRTSHISFASQLV